MLQKFRKGQGLTEFALILPILLMVLLGIIEGAWIVWAYINVQNAAREGARYAVTGSPLDNEGNPWTKDDPERIAAIKQVVVDNTFVPVEVYADNDLTNFNDHFSTPRALGILVRGQSAPDDLQGTVNHPGQKGLNVAVRVYYNVDLLDPIYNALMAGQAIHLEGQVALQNEGVNLALGGEVPSFAPPAGDTTAGTGGSGGLNEILAVRFGGSDATPGTLIPAGSQIDIFLDDHDGTKFYYVCFDGTAPPIPETQPAVDINPDGTYLITGHTIPFSTSPGSHLIVSSLNADCSSPVASASITVTDPTNPVVGISDGSHSDHKWPDNSLVNVFVSAHGDGSYTIVDDNTGLPMKRLDGSDCVVTVNPGQSSGTQSGCIIPNGLVGTYVISSSFATADVNVVTPGLLVQEGSNLTDNRLAHLIVKNHAPDHIYWAYFNGIEITDSPVTTNLDGEVVVSFYIPPAYNGSYDLITQDQSGALVAAREIAKMSVNVTALTTPAIISLDEAPAGTIIPIDLRNHSPLTTYEVKFENVLVATVDTDSNGDLINQVFYRIPVDQVGNKVIKAFLPSTTAFSASHTINVLQVPFIEIDGGSDHLPGETITVHLKNHQANSAYDVYLDLDPLIPGAETRIATGIVTDSSGDRTFTYLIPNDGTLAGNNPHAMDSVKDSNVAASTILNVIVADLEITAITPPTNPQPGIDLPIAISVTNNEAITITGFPFNNDLAVNRTFDVSQTLPPGIEKIWIQEIGPSQTTLITPVINVYNEGNYLLSGWTDTTNNVAETLETNNIFSTTMVIAPCNLTPFVDQFDTGSIATVQSTIPSTVRDNFGSTSFSNNDGTINWANSWQEGGESNGANNDSIRVTGGKLRFVNTVGRTALRQVNLAGATSPALSLKYNTSGNLESQDRVIVEISSAGGGGPWTTLDTYNNDQGSSVTNSYDISAHASANTAIRFRVASTNGSSSSEYFHFDEVQVSFLTGTASNWVMTAFNDAAPLPPIVSIEQEPEELIAMHQPLAQPAALNMVVPPALPVLQSRPQPVSGAGEAVANVGQPYMVQPAAASHNQTIPIAVSANRSDAAGDQPLGAISIAQATLWRLPGPAKPPAAQIAAQAIASPAGNETESSAVATGRATLEPGFETDTNTIQPPAVPEAAAAAAKPLAALTTYDFSGVNTTSCGSNGICAHESDVDLFPYTAAGNQNDFQEPNNTEYGLIAVDDTNYWETDDPGNNDEIFVQFDMKINEAIATISQIDFTFKGYTLPTGSNRTHRIYVKKTGVTPYAASSWDQVGTDATLNSGGTTTMARSLTANFADYIDPATGFITWGVYETTSSRAMRVRYVKMDVTFTANNPPNAPTTLLTEGLPTPVANVANLTPQFSWAFSDPDGGDTQSAWEIEVNTASNFGGTVMWDSTKSAGTSSQEDYAGTPLAFDGTTYYWRVRTWDAADAVSPWGATQQFTMYNNQAPSVTNPQTEGATNPINVLDTTPDFSWLFSDPDTGVTGDDQGAYEIEVGTDTNWATAESWDSGKVDTDLTSAVFAGTPLALDGTTYYWRIRVWDDQDLVGNWSADQQFTMFVNSLPSANNPQTEGATNPPSVSDSTPDFSWVFFDADVGDTQSAYQIQVGDDSNWADGAEMWDPGQVASGVATVVYAGTGIVRDGSTYYWRIKVWDSNNAEGNWSATQSFTMDTLPPFTAPTNLVVTPNANGSLDLSWSDNSSDDGQFRIERKQGAGPWTVVTTIDTSADPGFTGTRNYNDASVTCGGNDYTYRVVGVRGSDSAEGTSNEAAGTTGSCPSTPVSCSSGGEMTSTLTLCSAGSGITLTPDTSAGGYLFMNQTVNSNAFEMVVRLKSIPSINGNSLAGLEVRDDLGGGAKKVMVVVRNSNPKQIGVFTRGAVNGAVGQAVGWASLSSTPVWLRVARANGSFHFFYNTSNGADAPVLGAWTLLGSVQDTMDTGINAGLVNSAASSTASPSTWEQFSLGCVHASSTTCGVVTDAGATGTVTVDAINFTDSFSSVPANESWAPKSSTVGGFAAMSYTGGDYPSILAEIASKRPPMLEYSVNIETPGDYYPWIFGYNAGSGSDSVHIGLNGSVAAIDLQNSDKVEAGTSGLQWFNNTADGNRAILSNLGQGIHSINVWGRESGFEFIQILLTNDATFAPTGSAPQDQSNCLEPIPAEFPPNMEQCTNMLLNTSFEDSNSIHNPLASTWVIPDVDGQRATSGPPQGTSGSRSILFANRWNPPPLISTQNNDPFIYQTFQLPGWINSETTGQLTLFKAVSHHGAGDAADPLYFVLRDENGANLTTPVLLADGDDLPDAGASGPINPTGASWVKYDTTTKLSDLFTGGNTPQSSAGKSVQAYFYLPSNAQDPTNPTNFYMDNIQYRVCTTQPEPPDDASKGTIKGSLAVTGLGAVEGITVWAYKLDGSGGPLLTTYTINAGFGQPNYGFYNLDPGVYQVYAQFTTSSGILFDKGSSVTVTAGTTPATLNMLLTLP